MANFKKKERIAKSARVNHSHNIENTVEVGVFVQEKMEPINGKFIREVTPRKILRINNEMEGSNNRNINSNKRSIRSISNRNLLNNNTNKIKEDNNQLFHFHNENNLKTHEKDKVKKMKAVYSKSTFSTDSSHSTTVSQRKNNNKGENDSDGKTKNYSSTQLKNNEHLKKNNSYDFNVCRIKEKYMKSLNEYNLKFKERFHNSKEKTDQYKQVKMDNNNNYTQNKNIHYNVEVLKEVKEESDFTFKDDLKEKNQRELLTSNVIKQKSKTLVLNIINLIRLQQYHLVIRILWHH